MKFREHHNTITGKVGLIRTDCQFLTGHGYEEEIQPDGSSKFDLFFSLIFLQYFRYIAFNYTERGYYDNFEGSQTYVYDQHASGMVHKQQYHLCGSDNDECVQTATYVPCFLSQFFNFLSASSKPYNAEFVNQISENSSRRRAACFRLFHLQFAHPLRRQGKHVGDETGGQKLHRAPKTTSSQIPR